MATGSSTASTSALLFPPRFRPCRALLWTHATPFASSFNRSPHQLSTASCTVLISPSPRNRIRLLFSIAPSLSRHAIGSSSCTATLLAEAHRLFPASVSWDVSDAAFLACTSAASCSIIGSSADQRWPSVVYATLTNFELPCSISCAMLLCSSCSVCRAHPRFCMPCCAPRPRVVVSWAYSDKCRLAAWVAASTSVAPLPRVSAHTFD